MKRLNHPAVISAIVLLALAHVDVRAEVDEPATQPQQPPSLVDHPAVGVHGIPVRETDADLADDHRKH